MDETGEQQGIVEVAAYKAGKHQGEAIIWNLYVNEQHRRHGLARRLMEKAQEAARQSGCHTAALEWSLRESPHWVIDWYYRIGFDEKEFGRDCSLMKKDIKNQRTMKFKRDYKIEVTADMNDRTFWRMIRKGEPAKPTAEDKQVVAEMLEEILNKIKN